MRLFTHLNFGGNCEEAFQFYAKLLGGRITMMMKSDKLPPQMKPPAGMEDAVIHARLSIDGAELIGNDVPPQHFKPIRSSYLYLSVESTQRAEQIFAALAEGGEVGMKLEETFFASRFGQLRDRFGTLWTIIHEKGPASPSR